ncbi:FadR/GntR family transcriptional regulator [Actinomyces faecalis]|uniref:FadR/GntR family transcriptional regulator n=1 Tax=Actinomyces faecalis TaxID=2722820 RepID=UPI0015547892|nr:FCD domain-containing protein [Actinomyces faecalis]
MPTPARRTDVLDALGREIVSGRLRPGQALTLEEVQVRHGVSCTLARDCVRTLESLHLVESRRRVGIVVLPRRDWSALAPEVIRWQLQEDPQGPKIGGLTELRAAVEPVAAAAAARRATEEQRTRLLELAASIRACGQEGSVASYLDEDIAFHRLILQASQNDVFAVLAGVISEVLVARARMGGDSDVPRSEALNLHDRVAHAIASGDAEGAEEAMRALVAEVRRLLLERGLRGYLEA